MEFVFPRNTLRALRSLFQHVSVRSGSNWNLAVLVFEERGKPEYPEKKPLGAGARFSKVPKTFRARKTICEIANRLFWKADLLTCFQGNSKKNNCEV